MPIFLFIFLALLANGLLAFGLILQKKGVGKLPALQFQWTVIKAFFQHKIWLLGIVAQITGGVSLFFIYRFGYVSILQPVSSTSFVFLALFSYFYLKEALNWKEVVGIILILSAVVLLGLSNEMQEDSHTYIFLNMMIFLGGVLTIFLAVLTFLKMTHEKKHADILWGLLAGIGSGTGTFFIKGFWLSYEMDPVLISLLFLIPFLCFNGLFFFSIQRGFKAGKTVNVALFEDVTNKILVITGGIFCYQERLPQDELLAALRLLAFAFIIGGVIMLARYSQVEIPENKENNSIVMDEKGKA